MSDTNRGILFRGKRIDNGEWIKGFYVIIGGENHCIFTGRIDLTQGSVGFEYFKVDSKTVGRFTGLIDKNGTKIFEGDIIKTKMYGKDLGNINVNDYDIFVVEYEPSMFRLENHITAEVLFFMMTDIANMKSSATFTTTPNCWRQTMNKDRTIFKSKRTLLNEINILQSEIEQYKDSIIQSEAMIEKRKIAERNVEVLEDLNKKLKEELKEKDEEISRLSNAIYREGKRPCNKYCEFCEHGIAEAISFYNRRYLFNCDLDCECKDFVRKTHN